MAPRLHYLRPAGTKPAAWLHLARTVCRRAERLSCELLERDPDTTNAEVVKYLNRLSDLFFVMSRKVNDDGANDTLWKPGQRQS